MNFVLPEDGWPKLLRSKLTGALYLFVSERTAIDLSLPDVTVYDFKVPVSDSNWAPVEGQSITFSN